MENNNHLVNDIDMQINALGEKLRGIRQEKNYNLTKVATGSGISTSLLSQVERGMVIPSLNTLYALCNFYGVSLFELFAEENQEKKYELVRADERRKITFSGSPNIYELVSPASVTSVSVLEMVVGVRETHSSRAHSDAAVEHTHEECVLVQEGSLEVILDGDTILLEEGDSLYYNGEVPHEFRCVGEQEARVLLVTVPAV